jgi:hypothetical protein
VAALNVIAVCRSVPCTVYICVELDRLVAYIVCCKNFKKQLAGTDVRIRFRVALNRLVLRGVGND